MKQLSQNNDNNCHRHHQNDDDDYYGGGNMSDCNLYSSKSALHYFNLKHGENYKDTEIYAHLHSILKISFFTIKCQAKKTYKKNVSIKVKFFILRFELFLFKIKSNLPSVNCPHRSILEVPAY